MHKFTSMRSMASRALVFIKAMRIDGFSDNACCNRKLETHKQRYQQIDSSNRAHGILLQAEL